MANITIPVKYQVAYGILVSIIRFTLLMLKVNDMHISTENISEMVIDTANNITTSIKREDQGNAHCDYRYP